MSNKSIEKTAYCCLMGCIVLGATGIIVVGKNIILESDPSSPKSLLGAALTVLSFCLGAAGMSLIDTKK